MKSKYKNILVAVDGSEQSEKAFLEAIDLAKKNDLPLSVLAIIDESLLNNLAEGSNLLVLEKLENEADNYLHELTDKMKKTSFIEPPKIKYSISCDNPKMHIVQYSKENKIDLIVMGATGKGAIERALVGSTTAYVVNHAPCNVLVVR